MEASPHHPPAVLSLAHPQVAGAFNVVGTPRGLRALGNRQVPRPGPGGERGARGARGSWDRVSICWGEYKGPGSASGACTRSFRSECRGTEDGLALRRRGPNRRSGRVRSGADGLGWACRSQSRRGRRLERRQGVGSVLEGWPVVIGGGRAGGLQRLPSRSARESWGGRRAGGGGRSGVRGRNSMRRGRGGRVGWYRLRSRGCRNRGLRCGQGFGSVLEGGHVLVRIRGAAAGPRRRGTRHGVEGVEKIQRHIPPIGWYSSRGSWRRGQAGSRGTLCPSAPKAGGVIRRPRSAA